MKLGYIGKSFINLSSDVGVKATLWYIDAELDQWGSYTIQGLRNEIHGNTRKDQRYYQRKLCSWISRRDRIKSQHPELFI